MAAEPRKKRSEVGRRGFTRALVELLFVSIPFIVHFAFKLREGNLASFFMLPEWSFASTYLIGQSIVNYHSGTMDFKQHMDIERNSLITTVLIVLLIMVVIALFFVLDSEEFSGILVLGQMLLFFVSVIIFVVLNVFLRILNDPSLTLEEKLG